jgi:peroxiredoxin
MHATAKLAPGSKFPGVPIPSVSGGTIDIAAMDGWRLLIVYRGKHCPLCKKYFKTLTDLEPEFTAAGVAVAAISADPIEKAQADIAEFGWRFPVGYGLTEDQMRTLGLYISRPRTPPETDRPFAEPGLFVINPGGQLHTIDISNAPFARPDLAMILMGIKMAQEKNFPIRGTMS